MTELTVDNKLVKRDVGFPAARDVENSLRAAREQVESALMYANSAYNAGGDRLSTSDHWDALRGADIQLLAQRLGQLNLVVERLRVMALQDELMRKMRAKGAKPAVLDPEQPSQTTSSHSSAAE